VEGSLPVWESPDGRHFLTGDRKALRQPCEGLDYSPAKCSSKEVIDTNFITFVCLLLSDQQVSPLISHPVDMYTVRFLWLHCSVLFTPF
jgi:hypothetical protein